MKRDTDIIEALARKNLVSTDPAIVALEMPLRILAQVLKQSPETYDQGADKSIVANVSAAALESAVKTLRRKLSAGGIGRSKDQRDNAEKQAKPVREEFNRQLALGVPAHRLITATWKALRKADPNRYSLWGRKRVYRYVKRGR